MRKPLKIITTLILALLVLTPIIYLLVYPSYNELALGKNILDIYRISKDTTINLLTKISPSKDVFAQQTLEITDMEESLNTTDLVLADKLLEDTHTKLIVTSANIEGYISQGTTSQSMNEGFWHFPTSTYPGHQGNVVIIGHRFQYMPPAKNTFFNLDQIRVGDSVITQSDEGEYTYIVTDIKDVNPNDSSVLQQTDDYRITLITCTPLWTHEKRLVITAKLDKLYKKV